MIGKSKVRGVSGSGVERRPDEWIRVFGPECFRVG